MDSASALMDKGTMRILILGGTGEASALARGLLAGPEPVSVTLSLAGRTSQPKAEAVPTRIGGFGGAEGLAAWLVRERTDLVIDATHPFAAHIGANAALACARTETRLLAIRRPAWTALAGDRWTNVPDMAAAARALGEDPARVFLTIGRQEVAAFAVAPQHDYVVRAIEAVELAVPRLTVIRARGPFDAAAEAAFLAERGIAVLVSKNSGGSATYGKIAAARTLGLPVIMVARPAKPDVPSVPDVAAALDWVTRHQTTGRSAHHAAGTLRGV
ncbi:cobalt-precorrin-6A reductase [Methylobacterium sp. J-068]|uniref:cobalt-precorrin-6A reductase n=1 Tax=Methylobacterium sp. J-068 TaxID=2836649 RepID=UPI001FB88D0C|nr:cobalt-precorrin-6A reductase [Methylobacterium sp. J-068]MCJ2036840.1 cobalt-precorrin-6A reductase [Methylobacterium sp. J-068]